MKWKRLRRSEHVRDRRGTGRFPVGGRVGSGIGVLIVLVVIFLLGGDPRLLLEGLEGGGQLPPAQEFEAPAGNPEVEMVSHVLGSTEDVWSALFASEGATYRPPFLNLYDGYIQSACGLSSSATGPFYCPGDEQVYLDLGFFRELARLGGPGDFAAAYVVAHEVGHHVQTLTGTADVVHAARQRTSAAEGNALSVRMELQADCYAGVWAHHANRASAFLEPGDVEEGLAAAAAIGDDRLQRSAGRAVNPESFTHGTSEQRVYWLRTGLETGSLDACDTFSRAGKLGD